MLTVSQPDQCPSPVRRAVMRQQWLNLAFVHWRYDPVVVQHLLPPGLDVDTFDGAAWVGLIPFRMQGIGLPHGPAVPYLGSFSEVNVRTYVRHEGVPGVWFFSLDVDRVVPAVVARMSYRLPYCWGLSEHARYTDTLTTRVRRRWPQRVSDTSLVVEMGDSVESDDLDVFLTARWGLYSSARRGLRYAPVDHEPWRLRTGSLLRVDHALVEAAGLPTPVGEAHIRCSEGVSVRIGAPRRVHMR